MDIIFKIKPQTKGRPRARVINGKYATMYTPTSTRKYEEEIKQQYIDNGAPHFKDSLLKASVTFCFKIPKSTSAKNRDKILSKRTYYAKKKYDLDNLLKSLFDALNGIAYDDDCQVARITADKIYGGEDMIFLTLEEIENDTD